MRFIRDIIAEKSQAAGQTEAAALRYPLRLREQDRAEHAVTNIEAEVATAPVQDTACFTASPPPETQEETPVDLAAISAALAPDNPIHECEQSSEAFANYSIGRQEFVGQERSQEETALPENIDPFESLFSEGDMPVEEAVDVGQGVPPLTHQDTNLRPHEAKVPTMAAPTPSATEQAPVQAQPLATSAVEPQPEPTLPVQEASPPEVDLAALQANMAAHKPAGGRSSKGRVKTRLLGFSAPSSQAHDPMAQTQKVPAATEAHFPVGWLVVVEGPGKGASFSLFDGLTQIGRGEGQTVRLDYGDTTISRENHAAIAFDGEQRRFFFGHGGKANLVRLNGRPVLSTEDLAPNSIIRIGETTLRFVALCGDDFAWGDPEVAHDNLG